MLNEAKHLGHAGGLLRCNEAVEMLRSAGPLAG